MNVNHKCGSEVNSRMNKRQLPELDAAHNLKLYLQAPQLAAHKFITPFISCSPEGDDECRGGVRSSDPEVQVLIFYLLLQEHYFVSQTASGMNGIQMKIEESCDCYVVYTEEKPIGKYPLDVLESDAITKHNAEEVQALCYLKFLHHGKTMRSIQREIV